MPRAPRDGPDAIVGLSPGATPHVLRTPGGDRFVCCGVDLLLNQGRGIPEGRTRCPSCGGEIVVEFASGEFARVTPPGAIVFAVETPRSDGSVEVCCSDSAVFDSERCLREWVEARRGITGTTLRVPAYAVRAERILARREAGRARAL